MENTMTLTSQGIEKFVKIARPFPERDNMLETIRQLQTTKQYKCPTVSMFALHLIADLYSEDSSVQANVNRMKTNLESAAHDLLFFSKRLTDIAQHPGEN